MCSSTRNSCDDTTKFKIIIFKPVLLKKLTYERITIWRFPEKSFSRRRKLSGLTLRPLLTPMWHGWASKPGDCDERFWADALHGL